MESKNVILEKSIQFALDIISYSEILEESRKFAIGANVKEAQSCESRADFIHKLKVAAKEAEKTDYWLILCNKSLNYPHNKDLPNKLTELLRLLTAIISTAKKNYH